MVALVVVAVEPGGIEPHGPWMLSRAWDHPITGPSAPTICHRSARDAISWGSPEVLCFFISGINGWWLFANTPSIPVKPGAP